MTASVVWQWESRRCFRFVSRCSAWLTTGLLEPKVISVINAGKCHSQMGGANLLYARFAQLRRGRVLGASVALARRTCAESASFYSASSSLKRHDQRLQRRNLDAWTFGATKRALFGQEANRQRQRTRVSVL